jgi:subtilisin-like proprotein convertase family protein
VLILLMTLLALPIAQTAPLVEAKNRSRIVIKTFRNPAPIILINDYDTELPVLGSVYPSAIKVGGLKGPIRDVNLRLKNFLHTYPDEVQVLLVGPQGQTAHVMGNVGGSGEALDVTLRLDDEAAEPLPNEGAPQSGTFRPTAAPGSTDVFNPPAPLLNGNSALSVFDGTNPNGTWRLFVQDEYGESDSGVFAGGWTLEITAKVKAKKKR